MLLDGSANGRQSGPALDPAVQSAWWASLVVSVCIVVAVALEVVVAALTARLAQGLAHPAFLVAFVGCAVPTAGFLFTLLGAHRRQVQVARYTASLACAAGISVVLGEVWLVGGRTLLVATGAVVAVVGFIGSGSRLASVPKSSVLWVLCASAMAIVMTAALWAIPDGLTLNFRWNNEAQLNQLVPSANKVLANSSPNPCHPWSPPAVKQVLGTGAQLCGVPGQFELTDHASHWSINFRTTGADTCERHLDGLWWENVGNGVTCPIGFNGIGGG